MSNTYLGLPAMSLLKYCLWALYICLTVRCVTAEEDEALTITTTTAPVSQRSGRKYIPLRETQSIDENAYNTHVPSASGRSLPKANYLPYKHAGSGIMKKSGTNVNWSVWKGDETNNNDDDSDDNEGGQRWSQPGPWSNPDPWSVDPTYLMMLKNAMADFKGEQKPTGFLSKLGSDPSLLLIAASIPISLILAAALPTLMNKLMNGNSMPVISTTATGSDNKGRSNDMDLLPYLTPFMEAVGTFGAKSIRSPECMQRIFCQVARDRIPKKELGYVKKVTGIARFISDGNFLENYGMKDLVDSIGNGKCENIPCSNSKVFDGKSRYSNKL